MADFNQFGSVRPSQTADLKQCAQFEAMLADAVDGTLTREEQAAFDLHLVGCATCREMLADAKRGAAWMEMLRGQRPEPPAAMLERIFAQTSGAQTSGAQLSGSQMSGGQAIDDGRMAADAVFGMDGEAAARPELVGAALAGSKVLPFRKRVVRGFDVRAVTHTLLQPRLAMTAAMAFFSIALTLNLTGVRLSDLRASDLKPASIKRSLYTANAHVVRYYTNLRVVYELESRVRELQRSSEDDVPAAPTGESPAKNGSAAPASADPDKGTKGQDSVPPAKRRASPGTSRREPLRDDLRVLAGFSADRNVSTTDTLALLLADLPPQERGTV